MKARTKDRTAARGNVRRRPSAKAIHAIEQTIAQLPDLPVKAPIDGKVGNVEFDDANCTQCARCEGSFRLANGAEYQSRVEIEIYPEDSPTHDNVYITLHFRLWVPSGVEDAGIHEGERETVSLNWNQLEPLAVALSRAVANAKARGFLPARGETK
jgi:hypothetical protein